MVDTRRLKNKGAGVNPPAQVFHLEASDSLQFITEHEIRSHCDLRLFETGLPPESCRKGGRAEIPFTGRSQLIRELFPDIYARYRSQAPSTVRNLSSSLRWWWRFFDRLDALFPDNKPITSVADFSEIHYAHYAHLPYDQMPSSIVGSTFFGLLDATRERISASGPAAQKLHSFHWTAVSKGGGTRALVDFADVKLVYEHLKHECRPVLLRWEDDPEELPRQAEVVALLTLFALQTGWNISTVTGIDVSTRREDGSLDCIETNPMNPKTSILRAVVADEHEGDDEKSVDSEYVRIRAPKARAKGAIQRAVSRHAPIMGAYNILTKITKQTEPLRNLLRRYLGTLKRDLEIAKAQAAGTETVNDLLLEISAVELQIKSPWLYEQQTNYSHEGTIAEAIGFLKGTPKPALKSYARTINARLRPSEKPVPENMLYRDLRDAFISWRWMTSHSWLDAMLAAGHTSRQSLIQYLKRKQIKQRHHRQFLKLGDSLWDALRSTAPKKKKYRITFPELIGIVAAKVTDVPEQKIQRWCEGRELTYVGTGCLDFTHPPKSIAPDHKEGSGCRVQRCTLCQHVVLLPTSIPFLARRFAELQFGRRFMPEQAWQEGDYHVEMRNTQDALARFDQREVVYWIAKWEADITSGKHRPVLAEGAYA